MKIEILINATGFESHFNQASISICLWIKLKKRTYSKKKTKLWEKAVPWNLVAGRQFSKNSSWLNFEKEHILLINTSWGAHPYIFRPWHGMTTFKRQGWIYSFFLAFRLYGFWAKYFFPITLWFRTTHFLTRYVSCSWHCMTKFGIFVLHIYNFWEKYMSMMTYASKDYIQWHT